jgi:hopanoid C-2 methylase
MALLGEVRRRVLIVNCHADETRRAVARTRKVPQTLGPIFLAGGFHPARCEIRLYNEHSHGPLEDEQLLGWPDMLVLTGLTTALDRMRQVTAYARTRNPAVIVVGGGHAVRAFPRFCAGFLDYACLGDIEEIREVIAAAFGAPFAAEPMRPRFDLANWIGRIGYAESTRYCNFACSFCTLTAERRPYAMLDADELRAQLLLAGRRRVMVFLDNNFYGSDRRSFAARLACVRQQCEAGQFDGWCALVTSDFFARRENVARVRAAGCLALFTGVESFDTGWTAAQNKRQNGVRPQVDVIRECLEQGLVFSYGLMADLSTRTIAQVRAELDAIVAAPEITLPAYVSLTIPLPGTPYFYDCLDARLILPRTKVRDLESTTLSLRPLDGLAAAAAFVRELQTMRGYRARIARHTLAFWRRYRTRFRSDQMAIALSNAALLTAPVLATLPRRVGARAAGRTHISTTEPLDRWYTPAFRVESRYRSYFEPTLLTDEQGDIGATLAEDVDAGRPQPRFVSLAGSAVTRA